jgi:Fuc2NAc and GlcNAc transferase
MLVPVLLVGSLLLSWLATGLIRIYARRRLMDLPTARSSHSRPTPRGGGLAIVLVHMTSLVIALTLGMTNDRPAVVLLGGGLLVAIVGFIDDHGHVPAGLRLACHIGAIAFSVYWLGGLPPIDFGWGSISLGLPGSIVLLLYLVWYLNLFNFMDGIDGIAGVQILTMTLTASALIAWCGGESSAYLPLALLATATGGFLVWNWPPARIFMGDAGSGYAGFALGALSLWTVVEGWLTPWAWLIIGGAFLVDATATLLVRARAGMSLIEAHRSHAYQRLSRHWRGHLPVTLAFAGINLFWLGPWAYLATLWPRLGMACAIAALFPLAVIAMRLGAGRQGEIQGIQS